MNNKTTEFNFNSYDNSKQTIIIDGVNVAECVCFIEEFEFPNNLSGGYYKQHNLCECGVQGIASYSFLCADKPGCYYKQFQRAEQQLAKDEEIQVDMRLKIDELNGLVKRKEQECERLKKIINEAKNSKLDLKSFLVGETIQNEYEQQLDQLKKENKELKRKNANKRTSLKKKQSHIDQLKAENEKLKKTILQTCPNCGEAYLNHDGAKLIDKNFELENALQEIKKIAEEQQSWNDCNRRFSETESEDDIFAYNWSALKQILQKCEVIDE